jgi:hypothetical protein
MTKQEEHELYIKSPLYRYIFSQLSELNYKIARRKDQIKSLVAEQEADKRGKKALVELRREVIKNAGGVK